MVISFHRPSTWCAKCFSNSSFQRLGLPVGGGAAGLVDMEGPLAGPGEASRRGCSPAGSLLSPHTPLHTQEAFATPHLTLSPVWGRPGEGPSPHPNSAFSCSGECPNGPVRATAVGIPPWASRHWGRGGGRGGRAGCWPLGHERRGPGGAPTRPLDTSALCELLMVAHGTHTAAISVPRSSPHATVPAPSGDRCPPAGLSSEATMSVV